MLFRVSPRQQRHSRVPAVLLSIALGLVSVPLLSTPSHAQEIPSWEDVENARGDERATQEQIQRIEDALADAQQRSARAGSDALTALHDAEDAQSAATAATARTQQLSAASAEAEAALAAAHDAVGALSASRYRAETATPLSARLLTSQEPERLLAGLAAAERMGTIWNTLGTQAREASALARSLREQAVTAERAREETDAEAQRAAAAASEASSREAAGVAELSETIETLYAQLASLKGTAADVERRYWIGQAAAEEERKRQEEEERKRQEEEERARDAEQEPPAEVPAPEQPSAPEPDAPAPEPAAPAPEQPEPSAPEPPVDEGVSVDPDGAKAYARSAVAARGWGEDQFGCLVSLWDRESGWRADASNPSSGAYGIPQALPGDKMASAGPDWRTNGNTQIEWGLGYIAERYGTPCEAWNHSESVGWY